MLNYLDRVNVGFAALTMNKDLGFSPAVFGFGAGVLFVGYSLFQVPANAVLSRMGARRWMFCIMAIWGLISASNAFVQGPTSFYALRFLLGVAEAGLFPGMIFYLTLWFPQAYRARFTATFCGAIPLSFIIGGPLSGLILEMDGVARSSRLAMVVSHGRLAGVSARLRRARIAARRPGGRAMADRR